jgi:hypothetical protein
MPSLLDLPAAAETIKNPVCQFYLPILRAKKVDKR